ncbi:MAG: hypothetical protein H0U67_16545 [Gemmatimonadetes bacterium]|nr:hypothetical protein [Gemmatimonadota bacterium]
MSHLKLEELARCVEEEPTSFEAAHLASCSHCSGELEELREMTRALARLPIHTPPRSQWPVLRSKMMTEGLLHDSPARSAGHRGKLLRIAAAIAIFLAGGASGAVLVGSAGTGTMAGGTDVRSSMAITAQTPDDAGDQLRSAEELYLAALTRYAELTQDGSYVDPLNRLAALEGIMLTAQAALREAPADPVINGYLLTAMGQRDAMLRQISRPSEQDWF